MINFQRVTGGVYKTRVNFHRSMLIYDYSRFQLHRPELQRLIRTKNKFEDSHNYKILHLFFLFFVARV